MEEKEEYTFKEIINEEGLQVEDVEEVIIITKSNTLQLKLIP